LELFYGHLVYFVVIWYVFPRLGILDLEKSGNPGHNASTQKITSSQAHKEILSFTFKKLHSLLQRQC
jgi:hypothetical protein